LIVEPEGSLRLNAILKSIRSPEGRRATLLGVVGTVGLTLATDMRGYTVGKILDAFFAPEQRQKLVTRMLNGLLKRSSTSTMAKSPKRLCSNCLGS
jgi:hypothetical protein